MRKPDEERGVYRKYDVRRVDGGSGPGGKHEHCLYFVLDLVHDEFAAPALAAYAQACKEKFPVLSKELKSIFGRPVRGPEGQKDSDIRKI